MLAIMFKKKSKDQQQPQQQQPADLNSPAPQATPNYGGQPDVVGEATYEYLRRTRPWSSRALRQAGRQIVAMGGVYFG